MIDDGISEDEDFYVNMDEDYYQYEYDNYVIEDAVCVRGGAEGQIDQEEDGDESEVIVQVIGGADGQYYNQDCLQQLLISYLLLYSKQTVSNDNEGVKVRKGGEGIGDGGGEKDEEEDDYDDDDDDDEGGLVNNIIYFSYYY
ncbi:MAG: hypothetical protein EZS28_017027 [Streblomastix strix]|uniref:Uncharacterized protein n=1 Tax=Streblomastix strix TaxID=222440 RepID=A0A5J4VYZ4_9EUKA|nr:MAG: hypothetical protein EZS28_017027 [Streblomastix strix]